MRRRERETKAEQREGSESRGDVGSDAPLDRRRINCHPFGFSIMASWPTIPDETSLSLAC